MRSLLELLTATLLVRGAAASGGSKGGTGVDSRSMPADAVVTTVAVRNDASTPTPTLEPASADRRNDSDHDQVGDPDANNANDNDRDGYLDYKNDEHGNYHDGDDSNAVAFGRSVSTRDSQAVDAVVRRYYAFAAADDAGRACALLPAGLVKAIPIDFGLHGPSYLRGSTTCAGVLSRLFRRRHRELSAGVAVTSVRVKGGEAYALLSSPRMPAAYIILSRVRDAWRIGELLGGRLP